MHDNKVFKVVRKNGFHIVVSEKFSNAEWESIDSTNSLSGAMHTCAELNAHFSIDELEEKLHTEMCDIQMVLPL